MARKRKTPELHSEVLAGSNAEQGHKEKLKKYAGAKAHALSVADYILQHEVTLYKEAEVLRACSSWLIFRHFYLADKYRLIGGCTCKKHLLCAMCALRRSAKTVMAYESKIRPVLAGRSDLVPVLVTLTVKNGSDLEERTTHLESAFKRMIDNRRRAKNGSRHKTVFRLIDGAAGAFEFKRGSGSGLWHPHIHLFALVPSDVDFMEMEWDMSDEWRKLTRDSHNVDITPIDCSTDESFIKAICEVFRYALKFGEMEIEDQVHAYKVLRGKRLVRDFGSLHGVKISDDTNDSIEDELAMQPYIDLMYEYSGKLGYLLRCSCDTEELYTGPAQPKTTGGEKASRRLSSKLFLPVKDLSKPWRKRPLDQSYMDEWTEKAGIERTVLEEAPF